MAQSFTLKIQGLDKLISDAEKVGQDMPGRLYRAMVNSTTLVQNTAKEIGSSSFKNRTGTLRRSILKDVQGAHRGIIYVGEKYGEYVEEGTRPHVIYPKGGKRALRFKIDGKTVFSRRVNHPGTKPYPFMEPAYRKSTPKILDEYAKIGTEIVKALGD
jgi:HK97 gp10 family phage protein